MVPGYGCTINTGVPTTMEPQGRRPPFFHVAQYPFRSVTGSTSRQVLALNLDILCGLPSANRRIEINNPIYLDKPLNLRFNPVCYIARNGERFLRVAEWSTGEYLKHENFRKIKIWEISEESLNKRDPRWVSRLQKLGLWPTAVSSSKPVREDDLSPNLEVLVIHSWIRKFALNFL